MRTLLDRDGDRKWNGYADLSSERKWKTDCLGAQLGPHVHVAEMNSHGVTHVAFDNGSRNGSHGSAICGVRLIQIPWVDLAIIRLRPGVTLIGFLWWLVPAQNQGIVNARIR